MCTPILCSNYINSRCSIYTIFRKAYRRRVGCCWAHSWVKARCTGWAGEPPGKRAGVLAWLIVASGSVAYAFLLLGMYPFDAADIFDNIIHGRILGVYGGNPFVQAPAAFPQDPFTRYIAWNHSVSAYGPGWELLAGLTARLAGNGVLANVIMFKLLGGVFLAGSIVLVAVILRRKAPQRALAGVLLLAWNPVVLYETVGNGHNDIAMVFWVLLAVWALSQRRFTLAILALVTGALFKFIPLLMLPAAGLIALRDLPGWRARGRYLVVTGAAVLVLVWLVYWPFWQGSRILTIDRRMQLYTASVPAMVDELLRTVLPAQAVDYWVALVAAMVTAVYACWEGLHAWRNRSWLSFPTATYRIMMFYLLLTCLWFQQWYALWPLGIAALLPPGHAARLAALFGYTALSKQLVLEPLWLWIRPLPPKAWREVRLGPAVMTIPWLYVLLLWSTSRLRRSYHQANQASHLGDSC